MIHSELTADTSIMLSKSVEINGVTIIPVLRTLAGGTTFAFLASLSPVALVIIEGEKWEVVALQGGESITVEELETGDIRA